MTTLSCKNFQNVVASRLSGMIKFLLHHGVIMKNLKLLSLLRKQLPRLSASKLGALMSTPAPAVGAPVDKLRHLLVASRQVLQLPRVNRKLLPRLAGLYVHPFMHRRECMPVFQETYKVIEQLTRNRLSPLPQKCQEELLWASLLLPFAHACIRWPIANHVSATLLHPPTPGALLQSYRPSSSKCAIVSEFIRVKLSDSTGP